MRVASPSSHSHPPPVASLTCTHPVASLTCVHTPGCLAHVCASLSSQSHPSSHTHTCTPLFTACCLTHVCAPHSSQSNARVPDALPSPSHTPVKRRSKETNGGEIEKYMSVKVADLASSGCVMAQSSRSWRSSASALKGMKCLHGRSSGSKNSCTERNELPQH